ncbi:hypothetical protein [Chondrinema litorale]|uniref:hypothetical protein n=1 Tax=Chondrinema litorale TaxID=2994555 RepID=UPI00254350DC|nr:hypothetical protein [Chondrinema litorale]UZR97676.1 hypothetical protein OQ292_28125 [Chondrinema litorale]
MLAALFRIRKYKIAVFPNHYQLYVKLVRFGKFQPLDGTKVTFDPNDLDSQLEAMQNIELMKRQLILRHKPEFI